MEDHKKSPILVANKLEPLNTAEMESTKIEAFSLGIKTAIAITIAAVLLAIFGFALF